MLYKILPILALLTATLFGDSIPRVTGPQPGTQLIGESFSQQLCFDNNGTATGYEPQFELVTPAGIKLTAATFYGNPTILHQETCTATDCNVSNPLIGQPSSLSPVDGNESYYVLDFPIGSFATEWPQQCMDLTFELESSGDHVQPGNPLDIKTVGVFSLGETAVDDGNYTYGPEHTLTVDPNVYTIEKGNSATEGERATGSKYPITATITVDIAKDENVTNLQVVDDLDGGMQFIGITSNAGCAERQLPSTTSPGGTLELDCGAKTGILGSDLTITYTYYIPEADDNNDAILGGNCQWNPLINHAHATANHDFNNTQTPLDQIDANSTVTAKAITMLKTSQIHDDVSPTGFGPRDQVEYTLTMDISGYATQSKIVISDTIGDGQSYAVATANSYTLSTGATGSFDASNINVTPDAATGTSLIEFNLSNQLADDSSPSTVDANTTITVTFITTIDDDYKVINGGGHISMGDVVDNSVVLDTTMNGVICPSESSYTSNAVATEQLTKTIYAVNGTHPAPTPYLIHPGDTVTYRLKSVMPVKSFYNFKLLDYLPMPFFRAAQITVEGSAGSTTAGEWATGPDNTYNRSPILTVDAGQNSITWNYQDDNSTDENTVLDLLFTVTATNEPMADSLTLANIGGTKYKDAANQDFGTAGLVEVITQQPSVDISKTIISTTNDQGQTLPGASLDKVDANDTITYQIHLENTGHAIAYDVNITDRFEQDGTLGQGLHSCSIIRTDTNGTTGSSTTGDLFADTYTIASIDALSYFDVTYSCTVNQDANPGGDINNTATLKGYASGTGGPNFVAKLIESQTKLILTSKMEIVKNIVASSIPATNPDNNLNQGEIVNFEINVTLGEGTYTNYALTDNTCTGLTLQSQSANVVVSGTTVTILGTGGSVDGTLSYGCEKQAITSGTNTATVTADLMGSKTASTNWTVTDPNVVTSKNMSPSQADAGDTVTVKMDWTNDATHPAYQCTVTDPLDESVFDISTVSVTTTPADYTCSVAGNDVECVYVGDLTLPCPDGPAEFTVKVRDDVNTSSNLVNELSFEGVTLPSGHPGENNTTINGSVESNATDTLELRSPVAPVKIFTATSEDFTDPGDTRLNNTPAVAIGEVIDVNITYGFYEGTTLKVKLEDDLLNSGRLVYVPGTMTISRDNANLFVEESDINTSLTGNPMGTAVTVDDSKLSISDTLISLDIGDVLNSNSAPTSSVANLTLSFRVKVQNESSVQAGVLVGDRGRINFADGASGQPRDIRGNLREGRTFEPLPTITKDVNQTSVQAGTELTYTIKVCNDETSSGNFVSSGFDWVISDRIPDDILLSSGPDVNLNGTGATVDTSASSGQDINATIDQLDKGECIFISYEAIVQQSAQFGQIMTNTAKFQTTSLPGLYGTAGSLPVLATQEPGELNGERTGTGGINDLFGDDTATVTMDTGVITKDLLNPQTRYAIGEQAEYKIVVGLPRGESNNFKIIDTLPAGLHYEDATASIILGPNLTVSGTPLPAQVSGNTITFDFGDINTTSVSSIGIDYKVTVENTLSNQDGVTLQNAAKASYDDPNQAGTITIAPISLPTITVGEANLFMDKKITAGAVKAQAGSTVSWEVTIANNGHKTAYATDWNDTLPSHLAQISNAALVLNGTPAVLSGTTTDLNSSHLVVNNTTLSLPAFDLPVGSTVTVTFDSIVQNDAVAGETQTNNTDASYKSILGADGSPLGGRNSADCGDDDDNSKLNNYCESATADLVIDAGIAIDKHLQGSVDRFTIGQEVTYEMRVSVIEGITPNVVLTDTLPAGLKYVSHSCQDAGGTLMHFNCNLTNTSPVTIEMGDVNNTADGNTSNDYIDVELTALVENVVGNQNGDKPENGDAAGTLVTVTSDANASAVTVPVPITIIEPDLNVTKTVTPTISGTPSQALGDIVTYHILLSHTAASTADAYDVNFTDTLDPGLIYVPGSATGATVTQNGQVLTFGFAHLAQGDIRNISYKAQINPNAAVGENLNNSLDTVFAGLPDANGSADGGRNGKDGVGGALNDYALHTIVPVIPNDDTLTPVKDQAVKVDTNNDGLINAGDVLEYNLTVNNGLTYGVGEVNVTDVLDPNVTLMLNSIMINGTAYGDSSASDWTVTGFWYTYASSDVNISYNSDTNYFEIYWQNVLNAGSALDITYDAKINDGMVTESVFADSSTLQLAGGTAVAPGTVIENIFTVDSNRTVPVDSNEVNVTTDQRGIAGIPDKNITGSDQSFTTLSDVAVGEVIDVNLTFAFSGGTTRDVVLRDNYDPAQFSFVPGSENLALSSAAISVTNPVSIVEDGNGFSVDLGDVANTHYEDLNMTEDLILSFKLKVKNTSAVNRSDSLDDRADVTYLDYNRSGGQPDRNVTLQSNIASVTVLEPLPSIKKVNSNTAAQPGDPVTYTVTFCNDEAGTATDVTSAFDWTATDVLDNRLHPQGTPTTDVGATGAAMTASFSGQTLSVTIDQLDQGECVNVAYDILIDAGAAEDANISNTIHMQTTSLPGAVSGERTGTGIPVENDLHAFATSNIIIGNPSILKAVTAQQTFYAIGETVDYNVTINLPESVKSLDVNDTLPAGLVYNAGSVHLAVPAGVTVQKDPPTVTQNGSVVTFDLGDVNMTTKQTIYLEFNATVENALSNQQGDTLTNKVNMAYLEPDNNKELILPDVDAPAITVGEPTIVMTKMVTHGLVDSQAGDTVSYSITVKNTGATTAFATDWIDTLPEHLAEISNAKLSGTAYQSGTTRRLVDANFTLSTVNATNDTVALPAFDLPVGNTLTITFDAILQPDVVANEILNNTTTSSWKSVLGTGSRDGTDGIGSGLNNYAAEANASMEVNATIAITKQIDKPNASIGEELTYTLSVYFIRGLTPDVSITDVLPDGLTYISHTTQSTDAGLTFASDTKSGSGQTVVISLGDVSNTATNDDHIDIELKVRVDNVIGNQDGDKPANGGGAAGTSVTAKFNSPGVGTTEASVINPVTFTITEPDISTTKNVTPDTQALGDEVTYTVHVTNGGTSTAYDLNFTDTLPTGLTYVPGSSSETGVIHNGQILYFALAPLAPGASVDISYKATVDTTADITQPLVNKINGVYGSILDSNGLADGGRNGMDGINGLNNYVFEANATLQPNNDALTPVKSMTWKQDSNNDTVISAGDLLAYNLSVTNNLAYDAGDVNVTDTLSPDVTLLLNSVQIDGAAVGNDKPWSFDGTWYRYANAGNDIGLSYNIDTNYFEIYWQHVLASGGTLDITFDTKINDGNITEMVFLDGNTTDIQEKTAVTAGTVIANQFTVDSNRTVPTDSNEVNITTDQRGIATVPVKRLISTDQSFTDPGDLNLANTPPVAVGEIIDVEILFEFSGGTTKDVVLRDNFDLQHFVYVPNSTMLGRSSDHIEVSDTDLNNSFASANPVSVDDSKIIHDANGFSLAVGDVFNDDYNVLNATQSLVLTFKIKVENNDTVQAGATLNDHGSVSFSEYHADSNSSSTSELNSPDVGVMAVEPDVEVSKRVDPMSAKAGDQVLYTLKVCNDESNQTANTASAFDWTVTDTLPAEFDLGSSGYVPNSLATGATVMIDSAALPNLSATIDRLDQGECIRIEYNITVNGAAQFEQDINNTVRVEATSLPSTVPGERTGTGTPPLNDLNNTSTATLKVESPGVRKDIVAQKAYYPIGDKVEYNITLTFTGSAEDLTIVDHFPAGLAYVPGSARLRLPADTNVSFNPPQESGIGYDWTFVIGDLNITTAGNLYLELNATVEDIATNVDGTQLTNSMNMHFTDPNTGAPVDIHAISPAATVGEPELYVSKTITTDLSVPKSAGDIISYEIRLSNTGTTTAYYTEWEDKVPVHTGEIYNPHLAVHAGTAYETNTTRPVTDVNFSISTVDEPDDKIALIPFDLSPGATLVITFDTIIQPNVIPAETLVNITGATTQSTVFGGRKHTGELGDNYASVAEVSFSINQLPEAKDDGCYRVTTYSAYTWDIAANDKLGDGTRAEHTWRLITPPSNGRVSISEDGHATYTPNANFNGADSFRYEMEDSNGDKSQANVCIDVDCASSQTSDGGDAYSMWTMLTLMFFTAMIALYYVRKEENRREEENRYE